MKDDLIRKNVEDLISRKNLTKRELAKHLGIGETNINRKLTPKTTIEFLYDIAEIIGCDIKDLISDNNSNQTVTGNNNASSQHGHAAIISVPENVSSKIINDHGIEITCDGKLIQEAQQRIKDLEGKIQALETTIKAQEKLITVLERGNPSI